MYVSIRENLFDFNQTSDHMFKILQVAGFLVFFLSSFTLTAQEDSIIVRDVSNYPKPKAVEENHNMDIGLGLGLDYGGVFGVQVGFVPIKHLTLFAAGGYHMIGFSWEVGAKGLVIPKNNKNIARPFGKVMYGSNSVIKVEGASEYDKIYHGFTIGAGVELRFGKSRSNGLDLDLNFPLRTPEFWEDWNDIKNNPSLQVTQDPLPVAFSVGYHFEF